MKCTKDNSSYSGLVKADWIVMICIYIGTLLLHSLMAQCATIFNLTPDEYSVSAIAAFMNGYDWSSTVSLSGYYGYLQGLMYTPVFSLTDDPYTRYDLMIGINSLIVSFIPVIVYYLSRSVFSLKKGASTAFALICGLYPCYMLLTKYTWNESLCDIMPWLFLLVAFKALQSKGAKKQILSVLGAIVLVAGYAAHGRMLALLAGGIALTLIAFFAMKKKIFGFIAFFSGLCVSFVADLLAKDYFQNALWLLDEAGGSPTNTIEDSLSRIFTSGGDFFVNFLKTLIGHFFYFISSTWGFGAICIVMIIGALFMYFRRRIKPSADGAAYISDNEALLTVFALVSTAAVFVISVLFKCTSEHLEARCDTLIYGRYIEVFAPIALYATLLLIKRGRFSIYHALAALCSAAVINTLTILFVVPTVTGGTRMTSAMIMGLAPLRYGEKMKSLPDETSFFKIIITVMVVLLIILVIRFAIHDGKRMLRCVCIPLAVMLSYSNLYGYVEYTVVQSKNAMTGAKYMQQALDMVDGSGLETVCCYNVASERYIKGQYLLPESEFIIAKSMAALEELSERPHFIIADREDNLHAWVEGICLVGDINNNMQLYACTSGAYDWAASQGYQLSDNGSIYYSGEQLPASDNAVRGSDYTKAPRGAQVYTNYLTLFRKGTYRITITGTGVELGNSIITITSSKGEYTHDFRITKQRDGVLELELEASQKLEGVRIELSNSNSEPIIITGLEIERGADVPMYDLALNA